MIRLEADGAIVRMLYSDPRKSGETDIQINVGPGGRVELPPLPPKVRLTIELTRELARALNLAADLASRQVEVEHWGEV